VFTHTAAGAIFYVHDMITTAKKPNWTVALGMPVLIFISCVMISFSAKFRLHPDLLSNAILADLLVAAPLVYFLAIRKTTVPARTVIRLFILGLLIAGLIMKSHSNPILQFIKTWISPAVELWIIFLVAKKYRAANRTAKREHTSADFLMHCRSVMVQLTGNKKIGNILSSEIAVMYYAFFSSSAKSIDYQKRFTSYKQNGLPLVFAAILSIFLIETIGVHFLLMLWSQSFAWVITGLSIYTCIQLFGHIRALKARPIIINADSFEVHNGLAGDARIYFSNIDKIEFSAKKPAGRAFIKMALLNGLEGHNMVVYLKNQIEVTKIFGIEKRTDTILFFVDHPKEFSNSVKNLLPPV